MIPPYLSLILTWWYQYRHGHNIPLYIVKNTMRWCKYHEIFDFVNWTALLPHILFISSLTPLASINCTGRAFCGGCLFCCCAVLYDTLRRTGVDWLHTRLVCFWSPYSYCRTNSESESLSVSELFNTEHFIFSCFLLAMIDYARLQTIYWTPTLSQIETDSVSECAIKVSLV